MTNAERQVEALLTEVDRLRDERATLFAEVERLRGVVEAAREVVRLYGGPAKYPAIIELQVALAALEAGDG